MPAFGLGSSLGLRPRELPPPHVGIFLYSPPLITVQYSSVQYNSIQYSSVQISSLQFIAMQFHK